MQNGEKEKRVNKKYSPEFKVSVIIDMRNNHLGYYETISKYWGEEANPHNITSILKKWERIYLEEGADGFMVERRGRGTKADGMKKGRPRKELAPDVVEDLIAENQRLRMEIEYIKKLSALVLADERKNGKRR